MTRRMLAQLLATSAVVPAAIVAQAPQNPSDEQKAAADQMRANAEQLNKVKLAMSMEPAFHFKA